MLFSITYDLNSNECDNVSRFSYVLATIQSRSCHELAISHQASHRLSSYIQQRFSSAKSLTCRSSDGFSVASGRSLQATTQFPKECSTTMKRKTEKVSYLSTELVSILLILQFEILKDNKLV